MLLIVPIAGWIASIVNNVASCFLTASLILSPVIGLASVMLVPTRRSTSACVMSSNVTVQRCVPCTCRMACTPLTWPYRALLSRLLVPIVRRMNFWNR